MLGTDFVDLLKSRKASLDPNPEVIEAPHDALDITREDNVTALSHHTHRTLLLIVQPSLMLINAKLKEKRHSMLMPWGLNISLLRQKSVVQELFRSARILYLTETATDHIRKKTKPIHCQNMAEQNLKVKKIFKTTATLIL